MEPEFGPKFALLIEGKPLYINPQFMAHISGYFAKICYDGNYREKETRLVTIPGERFEDVKRLLECLGPINCRPISGSVSGTFVLFFGEGGIFVKTFDPCTKTSFQITQTM